MTLPAIPVAEHPGDCLGRARGCIGPRPAELAIVGRKLLQQHAHFALRPTPALAGDAATGEKSPGGIHTAHLDAFGLHWLHALANHEFGAAAADIHQQTPRVGRGQGICRTKPDQSRFLAPGHHLDRMAQRIFGRLQEVTGRGESAYCIGCHRTHAVGRQMRNTLTELRKTGQCSLTVRSIQTALGIDAGRQLHAVAQSIQHLQRAQSVARHNQVKAVGAKIDCGKQFVFFQ